MWNLIGPKNCRKRKKLMNVIRERDILNNRTKIE